MTFHELALPLVAGAEVAAGRGDKTSQITLFASAHPAEITRDYIVSIWRARALHDAAINAWPGIIAWAAGYRSGETNGERELDAAGAVAPAAQTRRGRMEEAELPL